MTRSKLLRLLPLLLLALAGCASSSVASKATITTASTASSTPASTGAGASASSTTAPPRSAPPSTGAVAAATLSVVACPTRDAANGSVSVTRPALVTTDLAPSITSRLSFYSGLLPVLAPRGWQCQAEIDEDGSTSVKVFPPGASAPGATASSDPGTEAVEAVSYGACQGCVFTTVCPFARFAGQQLGGGDLSCHLPGLGEVVDWIRGSAVATAPVDDVIGFEDPAGVAGDGMPSGGANPADGIVLYRDDSTHRGRSLAETCTLPTADHDLCTAILNTFGARAWAFGQS